MILNCFLDTVGERRWNGEEPRKKHQASFFGLFDRFQKPCLPSTTGWSSRKWENVLKREPDEVVKPFRWFCWYCSQHPIQHLSGAPCATLALLFPFGTRRKKTGEDIDLLVDQQVAKRNLQLTRRFIMKELISQSRSSQIQIDLGYRWRIEQVCFNQSDRHTWFYEG